MNTICNRQKWANQPQIDTKDTKKQNEQIGRKWTQYAQMNIIGTNGFKIDTKDTNRLKINTKDKLGDKIVRMDTICTNGQKRHNQSKDVHE